MPEQMIKILDIPFTTLHQSEVLEKFRQVLETPHEKLFLATPNPEMLLASLKNSSFKKILQSTDLNLPDGNGLIWAKKYFDQSRSSRNPFWLTLIGISSLIAFLWHQKNEKKPFNKAIHGSDLTLAMLNDQDISRHTFFLLGNKHGLNPEITQLTAQTLRKKHPHLKISGQADSDAHDPGLIEKISSSKAEILLIGFGAPTQETWLHQNLPKLPHVKIAIGIGGTFDFISGIIPRAPTWLRKIGLEWLFRLYKQPKRIRRIFNATIIFPYQIIKHRLANPDKSNI